MTEPSTWHEVADVVVVGGGGSDLAAAVAAAERGVIVVLLERRPALGGTTALSVGSFCAAGTRLQRRRGIADTPDAYLEDMQKFAPALAAREPPAQRAMLVAEATPTLHWLERLGVAFAGPFPEPPHRVPRLHMAVPGSRAYVARLALAAGRLDVRVLLAAPLVRLIADDGAIVGVEYARGGETRRLHASRGVVVATGDFSGNLAMRRQYLDPAASPAPPTNPDSTGDGQRFGAAVGAGLRNMDFTFGPSLQFPRAPHLTLPHHLPPWPWLTSLEAGAISRLPRRIVAPLGRLLMISSMSPSPTLFREGAILVDRDGERLGDERLLLADDPKSLARALATRPDATGHLVIDRLIADRFDGNPTYLSTAAAIGYATFDDYRRGRPDLVHAAADPAALAAAIGVPAPALARSLAAAPRAFRPTLFALGPLRSVLASTEGSLAADNSCRVLRDDGQPIPGLFAAGYTGEGGLFLPGHGMHLAWAFTSCRVAGETAARCPPT